MHNDRKKRLGAYFTPELAATVLVKWAVSSQSDRLLDPSCGDGNFLALHRRSVGVEQDNASAAKARARAPWALVHGGDFFSWAKGTKERFECAAGNPPFIRYQRFSGEVREAALTLCSLLGAKFSSLTSSWAPFLVAAASLLRPGGRMAFIVPAEIGHAPYAQPLLSYLVKNFADVRLLAVREKIFPDLSEDVWLLYAAGFGESTNSVIFEAVERLKPSQKLPNGMSIDVDELVSWGWRLRPFLLTKEARDLYRSVLAEQTTYRLGSVARVGIGYVTGDNDFFHLRPSQVKEGSFPHEFLLPTVRNSRVLPKDEVTKSTLVKWRKEDAPFLLLRIPSGVRVPREIRRYLETPSGDRARSSYKCRNREPWYAVPDVVLPDAFLSYMSSEGPALVKNYAKATCTNSLHFVKLTDRKHGNKLFNDWSKGFTRLSAELEGHPLGGGMLKVEPREAQRIALSEREKWSKREAVAINEALAKLREWRHIRA